MLYPWMLLTCWKLFWNRSISRPLFPLSWCTVFTVRMSRRERALFAQLLYICAKKIEALWNGFILSVLSMYEIYTSWVDCPTITQASKELLYLNGFTREKNKKLYVSKFFALFPGDAILKTTLYQHFQMESNNYTVLFFPFLRILFRPWVTWQSGSTGCRIKQQTEENKTIIRIIWCI